ncbi:hypothetical protein [Micavibrio aeruginosavorus]|uniref:phosphoribosylanthranilate isomerase n=1 Tax=Micavibrio aeruginosavorus TaxID=349221 RepID=UPI003F4ADF40
MKLQYCSITGADDEVDVQDMNTLAAEFPFVEWAILLLPARAGQLRFPTTNWIHSFSKQNHAKNTAMHLCDGGFLGFINGERDILDLMSGFKRIQLNLKFGDVEGKYDPAQLVARVRENPQHQFIIQYTKDKAGLLPLLADVPNHAVLFDESAGRGISPDSWDAPLAGHFCGYAGGMNPDNVQNNIDMIQKVANGHTTWIDMETGVRTDDHFDLSKVRRVLTTAAPYIQK